MQSPASTEKDSDSGCCADMSNHEDNGSHNHMNGKYSISLKMILHRPSLNVKVIHQRSSSPGQKCKIPVFSLVSEKVVHGGQVQCHKSQGQGQGQKCKFPFLTYMYFQRSRLKVARVKATVIVQGQS